MKRPLVSIIIVHYHVPGELFACIDSIIHSNPKVAYEIIVVDNDEKNHIEPELKTKYPKIRYVKNDNNVGFGAGNNIGVNHAKGDYLFFLNPDTLFVKNPLDVLIDFLKGYKEVGIVAPLLLNPNKKPYPLQGAKRLTPFRALFAFSFLNTLFPHNPVSKKYWMLEWDKKTVRSVDTVPGTAFMIGKSLFKKVEGFDERFFMFFEEEDLSRKVAKKGLNIVIEPKAQIVHLWGRSTLLLKEKETVFKNSRFYFFRKYYGLLVALFISLFLEIRKQHIMLAAILLVGSFLRFFRLQELMMFIGDQGWFFLSARDMIINGQIPLVGITASHTWLNQGPLWTYIVAGLFFAFNFNPIYPAFLVAGVGVLTVFLMYSVASRMFSNRIGIIAVFIYATSPLVVIHSRFAYHTSLIPFFVLLLMFSVYKWVRGNVYFFPLSLFFLLILYNLELATVVFFLPVMILIVYGLLEKKFWVINLFSKKIAFYSIFALIVMFPVFFYDFSNGFRQTLGLFTWIIYKTVSFFLSFFFGVVQSGNSNDFFLFLQEYNKRLLFAPSEYVSNILFFACVAFLVSYAIRHWQKLKLGYVIFLTFLITSFFGLFINKVQSEAYLPMLFPLIILLLSIFLEALTHKKYLAISCYIGIIFLTVINAYTLMSRNFYMDIDDGYGPSFQKRLAVSQYMINESGARAYGIIGKGKGSQFESFTMNYEYLTWWLGNGPAKSEADLNFVISEEDSSIQVRTIHD